MAKQLQLRGGTTDEHSTFTGATREVTVDTDKNTLVVHNGSTEGGFSIAKSNDIVNMASYYVDNSSDENNVELVNNAIITKIDKYYDGMVVIFTPANENTDATTLKVNTLDTKDLKYNGADIEAGFLKTGLKYLAVFNQAQDRFDVEPLTLGLDTKSLIGNDNGIIKDLDGNPIFSKVVNVVFYTICDNVTVTGNADVNVDLGGDANVTYSKLRGDTTLFIEASHHVYYGEENDASDVWSGGTTVIECDGTIISEESIYGLAHNSTTSNPNGRSMGYAIASGTKTSLSAGDVVIKALFRPCHSQQDDEDNKLNAYGEGFIKVWEVL